jgi:RNA polymerase sigma-70 factor (ECF subfamily)
MGQTADTLLVRLRRDGARQDWERFFDLYHPLLQFWARKLAPADEAEDLVQDVSLLVIQKLPSFTGAGDRSFLAWLRVVVRNRWRDMCRRAAARPRAGDPAALEEIAGEDDLGEVMVAEERGLLIRRALQVMRTDFEPTTWRACWETVACDRPAAEVATELGVSVEVVYAASYRVIRRLRDELSGAWR